MSAPGTQPQSAPHGAPATRLARLLVPFGADASVWRVLVARGLRALADGFMAVLLPAYLLALGFGVWEVGVLMVDAID